MGKATTDMPSAPPGGREGEGEGRSDNGQPRLRHRCALWCGVHCRALALVRPGWANWKNATCLGCFSHDRGKGPPPSVVMVLACAGWLPFGSGVVQRATEMHAPACT